jgi:hypothetical protein
MIKIISQSVRWYCIQEEIWWWIYKRAQWFWMRLGNDQASYWLDWLPAYCIRKYYYNLNKRRSKSEHK